MCQARFSNGSFDPELCPLLAGLSPEEIAERIASDPVIRSCVGIDSDVYCLKSPARLAGPSAVGTNKLKAGKALSTFA